MAGIKQPILDIVNRLQTIVNADGSNLYATIWNNQLNLSESGATYSFPFPCAFVEVQMPNEYSQLGCGITESDVTFKIHLGADQLSSGGAIPDLNITIFDFRDQVITLLSNYEPTSCSSLEKVAEHQDENYTNIYHYIIDFKCSFIDDRGSQQAGQISGTAILDLLAGFEPIEILSVNYQNQTLTIFYRLLQTQNVQFNLPNIGSIEVENCNAGENNNFVQSSYSLSTGNYSVTASVTGFTTQPFNFNI